jgi:hypothetical protein
LPLGVSGRASKMTIALGIIYSGSFDFRNCRSSLIISVTCGWGTM